jgi:DNA modification methylase
MVLQSKIFNETPINRQDIPQELLNIEDKQRSNPLPWKGQFSPQFIETLINKYAEKNSVIFDPFLGSGTVLYEAGRLGIEAHGTEINPAALTLANIYKFINLSQRKRQEYTNNFLKRLRAEIPDYTMPLFQNQNLQKEFTPNDIKEILVKLVNDDEGSPIRFLDEALVILLDFLL